MRLVLNSLHDEVAAKLRDRIFAGDLAPGSFVDEPALCAVLSISRMAWYNDCFAATRSLR